MDYHDNAKMSNPERKVLLMIDDMGQIYNREEKYPDPRFSIGTIEAISHLPPQEVTSILFGGDTPEGEFPVKCVELERVWSDTGWYDPRHLVRILKHPLGHCTHMFRCSKINVCPIRERNPEEIPLIERGAVYERDRPVVAEELSHMLMSIPIRKELARIIRSHQEEDSHWKEERFAVLYDTGSTRVDTVAFSDNAPRSSKPTDQELEQVHRAIVQEDARLVFDIHLHPMDTLKTKREKLTNPLAPSADDLVSAEMWQRASGGTVNPIMGIFNVLSDTKIRLLLYCPTQKAFRMNSINISNFEQDANDYGVQNEGVLLLLRDAGYRAEIIEMDLLQGISNADCEKFRTFALSANEVI